MFWMLVNQPEQMQKGEMNQKMHQTGHLPIYGEASPAVFDAVDDANVVTGSNAASVSFAALN
jgi:hypothetical protein